MLQAVLRRAPVVITMGVIFFLSHQPGELFTPYHFRWADKLAHLAVYALLCLTLIYSFEDRYRRTAKGMVVGVSIIFCLIYGLSDEFHQSFIPGRSPSFQTLQLMPSGPHWPVCFGCGGIRQVIQAV